MVANSTSSIRCSVSGAPPPVVTWINPSGQRIVNSSRFAVSPSNDLIIFPLTLQDQGVYTCVATNVVGMATDTVDVIVYIPATVSIATPFLTTVVGDSVDLQCVANGNPLPTVTWYKDQALVAGQTEETLPISMVTLADEGVYTCMATNEYGSDSKEIQLVVKSMHLLISLYDMCDLSLPLTLTLPLSPSPSLSLPLLSLSPSPSLFFCSSIPCHRGTSIKSDCACKLFCELYMHS